jgi:beta-lactam-binding protein with PASTA domain
VLRLLQRPFTAALLCWGATLWVLFYGVHLFIMPWVAGKFKPTADVPRLFGMKPEAADSLTRWRGLRLMTDSNADFSADIPAGRIQFQFPAAGTQVKPARRIWVRLSKGPSGVEMPALRGLSLRQAEISLGQSGLKLGQVRQVRSASVPANAVIGTHPGAGSPLEQGRSVDVDVSSGSGEKPGER